MKFLKDADKLTFPEVQTMVRGLLHLAQSDGIHPREEALIREFYDACRTPGGPAYEATIRTPFSFSDALSDLSSKETRRLFIKTCWFLAFADGKSTGPERTQIAEWAKGFGLSETECNEIGEDVKESLMAELAPHIKNVEALAAIRAQLRGA